MNLINIKLAVRFFLKDKLYTIINLLGLSLGLASVFFITLYAADELSFDSFQKKDVYRVALHRYFPDNDMQYAVTPQPIAHTLQNEFEEVAKATSIEGIPQSYKIENEQAEISFQENLVYRADSMFLEVLSIPMINGSIRSLDEPYSMVINKKIAQKYFGTTNCVGKKLLTNDTLEYTVTGVSEYLSEKSHLHFDILLSWSSFPPNQFQFQWVSYTTYNYVQLAENVNPEQLIAQFQRIVEKYTGPQVEAILSRPYEEYEAAGNVHNFYLQPVADIHLNSRLRNEMQTNGNKQYVNLFLIVGFVILMIAAINFTNLATARSMKRAKEVGVRKTLGSTRKKLFLQFFTESILLAFISGVIALVLFILLLPEFNSLSGKNISLLEMNWPFYGLVFLLIITMLGLLSGAYPSLFISTFNIVSILKGQVTKGKSKSTLRNLLVVLQFCISVFMIIGTILINRQVDFMVNKNLGFNKDQILTIDNANLLGNNFLSFKGQLEELNGINGVTSSIHVPGRNVGGMSFEAIGRPTTDRYLSGFMMTEYNFIDTYGIEFIEGRGFEDLRNDSASVIINETAVKTVGWDNPIGEKIKPTNMDVMNIIGVVKDFHFNSLHQKITPVVLFGYSLEHTHANQMFPPVLSVKIDSEANVASLISLLENKWEALVPEQPFNYTFLDEEYDELYRAELQFSKVFFLFSLLAIFIALIGVIGLSSFFALQKTKEIGIRKVLGASISNLMLVLSKDFIKMIVLANIITWPIAYLLFSKWLEQFPYGASLSWDIFILAAFLSAALVMLSISYQSLKSALTNPTKTIRND